jgi:peptide methionine sulfoxide reductase msrA/msrB
MIDATAPRDLVLACLAVLASWTACSSSSGQPRPTSEDGGAFTGPTQTALLAGGCFWGMEEILRKIPGVVATDVGYAYSARGEAEAVRVVFDPTRLSYTDLLEKWFFRMHDPTTLDRQGNDTGAEYRSALFVTSPEQRKIADEVKARVERSGRWKARVVTEIAAPTNPFKSASEHHQRYLQKNPGGYTCHYLRE